MGASPPLPRKVETGPGGEGVRLFLIQAIVLAFAVLAVMAFVFRSSSARRAMNLLRDGLLLYVLLVLLLGVILIVRGGL